MTGPIRQATQKALSFARVIRELGAVYITGFVCLLCVAIGFILGTISTTGIARDGITRFEETTKDAILRKYGR